MFTSCADERQVSLSYKGGEERYPPVDPAGLHTPDDQQVAENDLTVEPVTLFQLFQEAKDASDWERVDACPGLPSKRSRCYDSTKEPGIKPNLFARQLDTTVPPCL